MALVFMPNSPSLLIAAGTLWIMDASINISMEPFRAFVGDMLPDEQRTLGFTMQSFFIGTGAFVASWMPYILANWLHFSNSAPVGQLPQTVRYSFLFGGLVFISAVLWTVFSTREYSPEEMAQFEDTDIQDTREIIEKHEPVSRYLRRGIAWTLSGLILILPIWYFHLEKELYILAGGLGLFRDPSDA